MPMVDQLVDLLPVTSRKDWMKEIKRASVEEQVHPFSLFMSYLEDERYTCMKLAEQQKRRGDKSVKSQSTYDSVHVYDSHDDSFFDVNDYTDLTHDHPHYVNHANQSEASHQ